jgi:hypothetical protein
MGFGAIRADGSLVSTFGFSIWLLFGLDKLCWALVLNFIIKIKPGIGCRADGSLFPVLQPSPVR